MDSLFVSSPCLSPGSEIGDYVMMESCIDHGDFTDSSPSIVQPRRREARREKQKRDLPPPLTWHIPFVMRRYTTDDGRLVIIEEKAHHDYFRATRSEGRLVLELVANDESEPVDTEEREGGGTVDIESDDVKEIESLPVVTEDRKCYDYMRVIQENKCDDVEEIESEKNDAVEERESVPVMTGGGGKCYDYMRVRSSPCLFTMTVPTVRPVHI